ncbi:MAG: hypothetical protein JXM70_17695 [Pirellulales bacterium]|nr:hypothetical protein [Pirellulales bacterium]
MVVTKALNEMPDTTAGQTTSAAVEMILPSGSVLRWPGGDVNALAEAIAALEARLC